mmetsp:Transcript_41899/g.115513  ORF Transcript_41899/g.115513 Transcript_41899/m.115513 type:complete len:292 (+) Transcript_41899:92-967(+)
MDSVSDLVSAPLALWAQVVVYRVVPVVHVVAHDAAVLPVQALEHDLDHRLLKLEVLEPVVRHEPAPRRCEEVAGSKHHPVGVLRLHNPIPTQIETLRVFLFQVPHVVVVLRHVVPLLQETDAALGIANNEEATVREGRVGLQLRVVLLREQDELRPVQPVVVYGRGERLGRAQVRVRVDGNSEGAALRPILQQLFGHDLDLPPAHLPLREVALVVRNDVLDLVAVLFRVQAVEPIGECPESRGEHGGDVPQGRGPSGVDHKDADGGARVRLRKETLATACRRHGSAPVWAP